jgi:hypothetical protein
MTWVRADAIAIPVEKGRKDADLPASTEAVAGNAARRASRRREKIRGTGDSGLERQIDNDAFDIAHGRVPDS